MALIVDATVGGINANSFVTLEYAQAYHDGRLYSTAWNAASEARKNSAIVQATSLLADSFEWKGSVVTLEQALPFPRYSIFDRDKRLYPIDIIPPPVKNATAELANLLLAKNREAETGTEGISSLSVGSISIDFDKTDRPLAIPDSIVRMLSYLGEVVLPSSRVGIVAVPLLRT